MADILQFVAKKQPVSRKYSKIDDYSTMECVQEDTQKLADSLHITFDEAMQVASNFYKTYPMLIEHVRSVDFMLRK